MSIDRIDGNRLTFKADEVSGVRIWPAGTEPDIGEWFGRPAPRQCIARTKVRTYQGNAPDQPIWTVEYSTRQNEEEAGDYDQPGEFLPRRISFGGEALNLGTSTLAQFTGAGTVEQDLFKRVGMVALEYTKIYREWATMSNIISARLGRISDGAFNDIAGEQVLFDGAETEEYVTKSGARRWRAVLSFLVREFPWNYQFDPARGIWGEILINGVPNYLSADFRPLFSSF